MAWYNSILGGGAGNSYTSTSTSAASGTLVVSNGTGISIGTHPGQFYNAAQDAVHTIQSSFTEHHRKLYAVQVYADVIGWSVEHIHVPQNITSSDPKVAILKLTKEGEVIKDVGVRLGDHNFYIMREPKGDES